MARTAKLIRAALEKKFPLVKFSVRSDSYSMGASVRVNWTDGPTEKQVREVTEPFSGAGFDGMIDLKYHVTSWLLPDGTAVFGHSDGTVRSHGSDPSYDHPKPHPDAIKVHFGADYVFTNRAFSVPVLTQVATQIANEYGLTVPKIEVNSDGTASLGDGLYQRRDDWAGGMDLRTMIHRELQEV